EDTSHRSAITPAPISAAGPPPRTTIASISPGAAPDTFRRVMPASSVVRSLATVSAAITSNGHRLHRIEWAVRAIVAAAPLSAPAQPAGAGGDARAWHGGRGRRVQPPLGGWGARDAPSRRVQESWTRLDEPAGAMWAERS